MLRNKAVEKKQYFRTGLGKVGNFATHPNVAQDVIGFEQLAQVVGQSGDAEDGGSEKVDWSIVEV